MAEVLNTQFIAAKKRVTSEDTHEVWIYMLSVYSLVYKLELSSYYR